MYTNRPYKAIGTAIQLCLYQVQ